MKTRYAIDVHSIGYDDTRKVVEAASLREAKRFELAAKLEWCKANAVGRDSLGMPFVTTSKVK